MSVNRSSLSWNTWYYCYVIVGFPPLWPPWDRQFMGHPTHIWYKNVSENATLNGFKLIPRDFKRSASQDLPSVFNVLQFTLSGVTRVSRNSSLISRNIPQGTGWPIKYVPVLCFLLIIIQSKQLSEMKSVLSLSLFMEDICKVDLLGLAAVTDQFVVYTGI